MIAKTILDEPSAKMEKSFRELFFLRELEIISKDFILPADCDNKHDLSWLCLNIFSLKHTVNKFPVASQATIF